MGTLKLEMQLPVDGFTADVTEKRIGWYGIWATQSQTITHASYRVCREWQSLTLQKFSRSSGGSDRN
jgi:hypothetical protein